MNNWDMLPSPYIARWIDGPKRPWQIWSSMDLSCWRTKLELYEIPKGKTKYIGKTPVLHELVKWLGSTLMQSNQERSVVCLNSEERWRNLKPELQGQALASPKSLLSINLGKKGDPRQLPKPCILRLCPFQLKQPDPLSKVTKKPQQNIDSTLTTPTYWPN